MNVRGEMRIVAAGDDSALLSRIAASGGLSARVRKGGETRDPSDDTGEGGRCLLAATDDESLFDDAVWRPPYCAWIRADGLCAEALVELVARADRHDLFCSLTTASAAELHIAGRLAVAIGDRRPISETTREDLELALHEAISNGLVHGNLGVASIKGLTIDDLDLYSRAFTDRLADPALRDRRIEVSALLDDTGVTVDVRDQGAGYDLTTRHDTEGASGRGLELIAGIATSCEVLDGGRRITMRFTL